MSNFKQYYKGYYIETRKGGYAVIDGGSTLGIFEKYENAEKFIDNQDDVSEFVK